MEHFSGMHNWYACSHARPTFCNVCREALPGVTSHGLSCEGQCQGPAGVGLGAPSEAGLEQEGYRVMPTARHQWHPMGTITAPPSCSLQVQGTQALRCQSHQQLQVDNLGLHRH